MTAALERDRERRLRNAELTCAHHSSVLARLRNDLAACQLAQQRVLEALAVVRQRQELLEAAAARAAVKGKAGGAGAR